mmetsp:Transcript_17723/g.45604  ORF Transcript_17723/g.45604 Transcript_17723/m.45604 type:complete len:357 (-) Transcript_17723:841-1911(-)
MYQGAHREGLVVDLPAMPCCVHGKTELRRLSLLAPLLGAQPLLGGLADSSCFRDDSHTVGLVLLRPQLSDLAAIGASLGGNLSQAFFSNFSSCCGSLRHRRVVRHAPPPLSLHSQAVSKVRGFLPRAGSVSPSACLVCLGPVHLLLVPKLRKVLIPAARCFRFCCHFFKLLLMAASLLLRSAQPLSHCLDLSPGDRKLAPQCNQIHLRLHRRALRFFGRRRFGLCSFRFNTSSTPVDCRQSLQPRPLSSQLHSHLQLGLPVFPRLLELSSTLLRFVVHGEQRCCQGLLFLHLAMTAVRRRAGFTEILLPFCFPSSLCLRLRGHGRGLLLEQGVARGLDRRLCSSLGFGQLASQHRC